MPYLSKNVISNFRKTYGYAGDKVKVVADHDDVIIVENANHERFAIKRELLTYDNTDIAKESLDPFAKQKPAKNKNKFLNQENQITLF